MAAKTPYERLKSWRATHKEQLKIQQRRYYLKHKDRIKEYLRNYLRAKKLKNAQDISNTEVSKAPQG